MTYQKNENKSVQAGFTIIELLVVIAIMGLMAGVLMIDFGTERTARNMNIAANELESNLRKLQAYALSARNLEGGTPVQFYVLKIDARSASSTTYELQAIYDRYSQPKLRTLEKIKLPNTVRIAPVTSSDSTTGLFLERPTVPTTFRPTCVLVAFEVPFANITTTYVDRPAPYDGCMINPVEPFKDDPAADRYDDYRKLLNFVFNTGGYPVSQDSNLTIRLQDIKSGALGKQILIKGVSGKIFRQ